MVSRPELRIRSRLFGKEERLGEHCPNRHLRLPLQILFWLHLNGSSASTVPARQDVDQKMRRRFGDGQLDQCQYKGVSQMCIDN